MRTTLTLDDDLARRLKSESRKSGRPFKQVVNALLRAGLEASARPRPQRRFRVHARALGTRPGVNTLKTSELLDWADGAYAR